MKYLRQIADLGPIVRPVVDELDAHPELWNQHTLRTGYAQTPHHVDDIWVRYRAWPEWRGIKLAHEHKPLRVGVTRGDTTELTQEPYDENLAIAQFVGEEHESAWYPAIDVLPHLRALIFEVMREFEVERLGGVLITRIPPGGKVLPHIDRGWHASYYEKLAVQIKSAPKQAFCFEDGRFECPPGTIYAFDNSQSHWVDNDSDVERVTCIICVRRDQRSSPLHRGNEE